MITENTREGVAAAEGSGKRRGRSAVPSADAPGEIAAVKALACCPAA
jgi:hypothetical protein